MLLGQEEHAKLRIKINQENICLQHRPSDTSDLTVENATRAVPKELYNFIP